MPEQEPKFKGTYPDSPSGNFKVIDVIGVPHPYCIGPKHVALAADRFCGILGNEAIEEAERRGIHCATCRGELSLKEHETALLVGCKVDFKDHKDEVSTWLKSIVAEAEKHKYAGFAFVRI